MLSVICNYMLECVLYIHLCLLLCVDVALVFLPADEHVFRSGRNSYVIAQCAT